MINYRTNTPGPGDGPGGGYTGPEIGDAAERDAGFMDFGGKDSGEKGFFGKDAFHKHEEDSCYKVWVRKSHECEPRRRPEPCYRPVPCYYPVPYHYPEPCHDPWPWHEQKEHDHKEHDKKKCREVILAAATGGAGPLPAICEPLGEPISIVSVTVDPKKLCDHDPNVLLNYTSVISAPLCVTLNLCFQVLRSIDNGPAVPISPTFTFVRKVETPSTFDFGFQFFDANVQGHTVTYTVVLTSTSTISVDAGVTIVNATLSAVAAPA